MAQTRTDTFEGPDVSDLREMLALASRARRWRVIIALTKWGVGLSLLFGIAWLGYRFLW